MTEKYPAIEAAEKYSEGTIQALREKLQKSSKRDDFAIVTVGSFARREASERSDLDFFFIKTSEDKSVAAEVEAFRELFVSLGIKS